MTPSQMRLGARDCSARIRRHAPHIAGCCGFMSRTIALCKRASWAKPRIITACRGSRQMNRVYLCSIRSPALFLTSHVLVPHVVGPRTGDACGLSSRPAKAEHARDEG